MLDHSEKKSSVPLRKGIKNPGVAAILIKGQLPPLSSQQDRLKWLKNCQN